MSQKTVIPVAFDDLPENEGLIFKLIFSVSERTRNRNYQYGLADEGYAGPCLRIAGSKATTSDTPGQLIIRVCDRNESTEGPTIHRPLIATRVLGTMDQLVEKFNILQAVKEAGAVQSSNNEVQEESPVYPRQGEQTDDTDRFVEFSISEEEASELAIVHDDTLASPANMEEQQAVAETGMEAPTTPDGLTSEEQIRDTDVTSSFSPSTQIVQAALVVDDSASVRKQLEIELDLFEVAVDYAEDAERARDLLAQKNYDVAFLDVVLPDQDGFSICKQIKANSDSRSTKVIMLTGKASHADKVRGSLAGCDAYLVKPVGRQTFQATVKKYLKPIENVQVMEA